MAELVDALDSKSSSFGSAGSIPAPGTKSRVRVKSESDSFSTLLFFFTLTLELTLKKLAMFDFEKLEVYKKAKAFNKGVRTFIRESTLDRTTNDQLRRAAFSVVLNLAEGSGRFSKPDRRNFFVVSRSSVFECVAILDILKDEGGISSELFERFYNQAEELSKIIFAMIRNLEK